VQVRRLVYLLTLSGPSPGAPPPPRMQVPTHLVVHCSALADLGCLIRSCFPSPPAHQLLVSTKVARSLSGSVFAPTHARTGERGRDVGEGVRLGRRRRQDGRESQRHHGLRRRRRHPPGRMAGCVASALAQATRRGDGGTSTGQERAHRGLAESR